MMYPIIAALLAGILLLIGPVWLVQVPFAIVRVVTRSIRGLLGNSGVSTEGDWVYYRDYSGTVRQHRVSGRMESLNDGAWHHVGGRGDTR
jgi:hypothetical protein